MKEGYKEPNNEGVPPIPDDPFITLGLQRGASVKEIRLAYRKLAPFCHSDHGNDAGDWFIAITEARNILIEPQTLHRRALYYKSFDFFWGNASGSQSPLETFFTAKKEREARAAADQAEQDRQANKSNSQSADNTASPEPDPTPEGEPEQGPENNAGGGPEPEPESTPEPEEGPVDPENPEEPPISAEERERLLDGALSVARDVYATKLIEWKNANRQKKNKFMQLLSDLGIEKQMPHAERSQELKDAEDEYILAKKNKSEKFFLNVINTDLMDQAEREYEALQQKILDSVPPLEKGIVGKAFERWAKLSPAKRIALSTALMTVGVVAFGSVGLVGAATYAGSRVVRGGIGAMAGQVTGKVVDRFQKRNIRKNKEEALDTYGESIDMDNFERKEKELMEYFDKQENKVKRQRLTKIAAMAASGAWVGLTTGALQSHYVPSGGGAVDHHTMEKGAKDFLDKHHPVPPDQKVLDAELSEQIAKTGLDTKVDLSSRGFIQTFDDLKAKLVDQYGGADKIPSHLKAEIFDKPSTQLAQKFGFYDPEKHLSGTGYKGEQLEIDQDGNITYNHINGSKDVLFDAKSGDVSEFHGKMFGGEDTTVETPETSTETIAPEVKPTTNVVYGQNFEYDGSTHRLVNDGQSHKLIFRNDTDPLSNFEIGYEETFGNSEEKMFVLDDKFQDGDRYLPIRGAFSLMHEEIINKIHDQQLEITTRPFEGGIVDIVHNNSDETVSVLLNGKKIASGIATENGSLVELNPTLKSWGFFQDTVYERALKSVNEVIGQIKRTN